MRFKNMSSESEAVQEQGNSNALGQGDVVGKSWRQETHLINVSFVQYNVLQK